ncbi:metallo-mystery pair system four-Cys motif protein [Motilimonas sp. 1_MG-2023]|uniref:MbnP family copper-binding protein n=1 Tax=Motilimonas sp. 1_MG-2023 TaxID=3062672 RepID=UPI0026E153F3|nr:MbnP family copper-binding protein [Motilimonas sp. 1_MG-2023]MDO6527162.1 metallo-mystery pair system four-Cys motif protein [Motilimonas sp. 1_MG-2023]
MSNKYQLKALASSLFVSSVLIGCGGSGGGSPVETTAPVDPVPTVEPSAPPALQNVELKFAARVGEQPVSCQIMDTAIAGTQNTQPEFTDVRMYISEVILINETGKEVALELTQDKKWQYKNVALLDFETGQDNCANGNEALNHLIKGTVPTDKYTSVKFTLGVPAELNHYGIDGDDAVSPLDVMGMNWSWQKGHKHLRMDIKGWNLHLGTTGCEVTDLATETVDCSNSRPNRPTYQFDSIDIANSTIVFDYQKLVANSDLTTNQPQTPPGCMSSATDADCGNVFTKLGLDLTTGQCIGGDCSAAQTWITVE